MFFLKPTRNNWLRPSSFYDMIDEFFNDPFFAPYPSTFRTDIKETNDAYLIEAELPGVNREDIKIEYADERLFISVNKEAKVDEEKDNYIRKERRMAAMKRSFYVGDVIEDQITAQLENGILKINVPKQEKVSSSRLIEIK